VTPTPAAPAVSDEQLKLDRDTCADMAKHWARCATHPETWTRLSAICDELLRLRSPPATEAKSQAEQMRDPATVIHYIAHAKRFDRFHFDDDTAFADWAQSLARHVINEEKPT
jgi:hypothetical protein